MRFRLQEQTETAQLQAMFGMASIGIAQADPRTGQWLRVNQTMCDITGYTAEEMLTLRVAEITHPEDRDKDWLAFQRVVRGEAPNYRMEKRYIRKDGTVVWVNVNMTIIRDAAGQPVRTMATIENIAERKADEAEILRLNRLYLALSEIGHFTTQTKAQEELLEGVCRILVQDGGLGAAWIGWHDCETSRVLPVAQYGDPGGYLEQITVFTDDRPEGLGPAGTSVRENHTVVCNDFVNAAETAAWRDVAAQIGIQSSASFPIRDQGRVRGVLTVYSDEAGYFRDKEVRLLEGAASDISFALTHLKLDASRRHAEESLRISEERYHSLIEANFDWVWELDAQGRYTYASPKVTTLLGYTPEEIIGRTPFCLMPYDEAERVAEVFAEHIKARRAFVSLENVNCHKDGRLITLETSGIPIAGPDGEFLGYRGVDRDVTERRQAERLLEEQQTKLVASSKMASLGVMASAIAHEINNPLGIISGAAEQLEVALADSQINLAHASSLSAKITRNVDRISNIVRALRVLAREGISDPLEKVSVKKIVDDSLALCMARFKEIGVRLLISEVSPDLFVEVRPDLISQVLINVLNNAYDAVAGLDDRWIRFSVVEESGMITIITTDAGLRPSADCLNKMFAPFFTTKSAGQGMGLGLSLSKSILEECGAQIFVDEQNPNTSIVIRIPAVQANTEGA